MVTTLSLTQEVEGISVGADSPSGKQHNGRIYTLDEHITGEQLVTIILSRGKIFHDPALHLHKNESAQVMC
jgi:hypothetical protein